MSHPPEDILEGYALDPEAQDDSVLEELLPHLRECAACREWTDYLRAFYGQFRRLPFSTTPALERLLDSVRPPATVFALRPFQRWSADEPRSPRRTTVLAAAGDTLSGGRYHRLSVLSSEEEGVVLRLIYDAQEDAVDLFLISSELRKRQHAIVSFPVLHLECVTDREGRSRFRGVKKVRDIEWATQYAVVRLPMCEIPLTLTGETRRTVGEPESHSVTARLDERGVSVTIASLARQTRPITTALVEDEGNRVSIIPLENGAGTAPVIGSPTRLTLRLYN